jgi:ribosomal peptide maturation radical SAM protein 1
VDVALAVVPFADVTRPAIGVSLLKAELAQRHLAARICYFNLELASLLGEELYTYISSIAPADAMIGEWFFADLVFADQIPASHEFTQRILQRVAEPRLVARILEARSHRGAFVDRCAQALKRTGAPIIGFTTTFHQTCASLAIAKRLKEAACPAVICIGGANCEGEMGHEMIRSFPWIDYVCTREGDEVFPEFVENFVREHRTASLPGFLRRGENAPLSYPPMIRNMDALPVPDYEDYIEAADRAELGTSLRRELQFESARGCWWGAKHHCTFCGLNGDTMPFRSKSPDRVYQEIRELHRRYGLKRLDAVDNILDHRYIGQVFERLAADGLGLEIFYEVKANLSRAQLEVLRRGGVAAVQPGIESLSTPILKLMKKGVTATQNLQLIKWCAEVGIVPAWNILAGFPGESPAEYERMAELIPLLTHLEPPTGCSRIRLDRFSPLYNQAERSGIIRVRPTHAYYFVFPLGRRELARLAYFFEFDYADGRNPEAYTVGLQNAVTRWRNAHCASGGARPKLDARILEGGAIVHVADTRPSALQADHVLSGLEARLLVECDTAHSLATLRRRFPAAGVGDEIEEPLRRLIARRLMIEIDDLYLSLPVIRDRASIDQESEPHAHMRRTTASTDALSSLRGAAG